MNVLLLALGAQVLSTPAVPAPPTQTPLPSVVAGASLAPSPTQTPTDTQRLVGLSPGTSPATVAALVGARVVGSFGDLTNPLSSGGPSSVALLQWRAPVLAAAGELQLAGLPGVLFAEPNRSVLPPETGECGAIVHGPQQCTAAFFDATPTGPEFVAQSAIPTLKVDQSTAPSGVAGTIVAVIDTGLDLVHPLFAGRLYGAGYDFLTEQALGWDFANGVDDDLDGLVDEAYGHGTHVAGTVALIDPTARFLPYRVLDADGRGTAFDVARAIVRAADDGAQIINLSLSLSGPSAAVEEALEYATEDGDIAVFAAAGNTGSLGIAFPAAYEEVVAVSALRTDTQLAEFAAFGPELDLLAPGVDIYSAMPGNLWATWSGTSMATACASGAASRLHSWQQAKYEPEDASEALEDSAATLDAANPTLAGFLGEGRIDVSAAGQQLIAGD
jgi:subtilisin family serine protease